MADLYAESALALTLFQRERGFGDTLFKPTPTKAGLILMRRGAGRAYPEGGAVVFRTPLSYSSAISASE